MPTITVPPRNSSHEENPGKVGKNNLIVTNTGNAAATDFVRSLVLDNTMIDTNIFHVSMAESVQSIMSGWYRSNDRFPDCLAFLVASDQVDSTVSTSEDGTFMRYPHVITVSKPIDFAEIGLSMVSLFKRWESKSNRTVINVDSIDELLDDGGVEETMQFLHLFTLWVERIDATCFYRYSGQRHDVDRAIFESMFDVIIEIDDAGRIVLRR